MLVTGNLGPSLALSFSPPDFCLHAHHQQRNVSNFLSSFLLITHLLSIQASAQLAVSCAVSQTSSAVEQSAHISHQEAPSSAYMWGSFRHQMLKKSDLSLCSAWIGMKQKVRVWSNKRENEAVTWPPPCVPGELYCLRLPGSHLTCSPLGAFIYINAWGVKCSESPWTSIAVRRKGALTWQWYSVMRKNVPWSFQVDLRTFLNAVCHNMSDTQWAAQELKPSTAQYGFLKERAVIFSSSKTKGINMIFDKYV